MCRGPPPKVCFIYQEPHLAGKDYAMNNKLKEAIICTLENYRKYTQQIALLRYELTHRDRITADEMLEAMAFSKGTGNVPTKGHISDKTYYVALNYLERTADLDAECISIITEQLEALEMRVNRLKHCVKQLRPHHKQVIVGLYFDEKNFRMLSSEMHVSERTIQRYRDAAIDELAEMYEILCVAGIKTE